MPILGTSKTRFGIRAIMERVGGPYDNKVASVTLGGELIIIDDITEIEEEEK